MSDEVSNGAVLDALNKLVARLDALERKVDGLSHVPADPLRARLADPEISGGLARILDRIDALETAVRTVESVAQRAPILVDGGAETLDHFMMQAEEQGIDVFDRGLKGLAVLEKASRPENLALVDELLDHAGAVRFAASAGSRAVSSLEASASLDTVSERLGALAGKGGAVLASPVLDKLLDGPLLDPAKLERAVDALQRLAEVASTPAFGKLLDSGLLDAAALSTASAAGTALVEARAGAVEPVGLFGTLGKLGDPDVQKAMGFAFALAKRFGATL